MVPGGDHAWAKMAQVFTPLRTIAATGIGAITVAAVGRRTVWADELKTPALKKLSIYDSEEPEILVTQTESELVETIGRTRRILARAGEESKDGIQGVIASWIRVERRVESRIRSLISPEEPLTPGILYVGVAALSGSVFARGRSLPTRVLLPPTLFFGALNYFLPKTTHNVNAYVYGLERAHAPALADTHDAADKALRDAVKQIRTSYNSMRGGVSHIVEDSVDGLESTTGLKLRDATIGRAQQVSEATQDKASSIAHNIQEKTAELQKRAVAIAEDVQSRLGQSESKKPGVPAGLPAKPKEPEAPLERVKEKVEEAVNKVSNDPSAPEHLAMGRKQKAKVTKAANNSCTDATTTSQPGKRAEKQVGHGKSEEITCTSELVPIPSCQALVDKDCRAKCGGVSTSSDGNWCEYHTKMRADLYTLFHNCLQVYHSTSDSLPNMALIQEAVDLDWVEGYWEPLHTRIDLLNKAILCRTCFMDRLQGNDLDFKTRKYIKGLRDVRIRLQSNLRIIEERMFILIGSASEYQRSIFIMSSQSFCHTDQQQRRCVHRDVHSDGDTRTFMFPIDRQHRYQLNSNFQGSVVDAYIAAELRRFRTELLEKLGVQVVRPTDYEDNDQYKLIVHWDSHDERRRAHIAAAYFRRLCFLESHLFVQAHHHMRALENGRLPPITIENPRGCQLDFDKDVDPSLLCMITFLLSPHLKESHLFMLCDYLWWPASREIRTAMQDIYIDEDAYSEGKPPVKPWWGKPPTPESFAAWNDHDDPEGAFPLLCGMLYEASYPQAHRDDVLTTEYWPHFGSLIRCGKCLLLMSWSSDEWFILVRAFAIRRIPMYSRIFPQVMGDGIGRLWASDLPTDLVRGQSNRSRSLGLAFHGDEPELENSQAPMSPDFGSNYGLDETLEIAGVVMLGVVTGGPITRPDITDDRRRRFLESYKLYPQIWFLLTSDHNPKHKDFALDFVHRLVLRARRRGSDLMISGMAIEHPEIEQDLLSVPPFHNASKRRPGASPWWQPMHIEFDFLQTVAGLKYEPVPHRLMGDCPMIHLACRPTNSNGVRWLLDVVLEAAIEATLVRTKAELEKAWITAELGWTDLEEGTLSYQFGPWHHPDTKKKDMATQTSRIGPELEREDWPSNTLISGLQELHTGAVDRRLQETPPYTCRSHIPTYEATGRCSLSQETLMVDCSTPVGLPQTTIPQDYELHDSPRFSGAETNSTSQSSNPGSPLDEHASRERDIFSEFVPPSNDCGQVTHIDWFDLVMSEEGDKLPDLSDWGDARIGQSLVVL
ncbi:unnamed protein product [Rhizoctonia solani]|uniref:MICOS complex subunit n=1 Tax=Rhizoctonia solani TaxID=456999 RepID=A0A8H3CHI7_9AGAM|nr:unnamed protein product [Rhizoctonia solani]